MKYKFLSLVLLIAVAFSCIRDDEHKDITSEDDYIKVGDLLPRISATSANTANLKPDDIAGKKGLVVLFFTSCPACQRELPKIEWIREETSQLSDFILIPISREEEKDIVVNYWNKNNYQMPVYLDPDRHIFNSFASKNVPRLYLFDTTGKVIWMHTGELEIAKENLLEMINNI